MPNFLVSLLSVIGYPVLIVLSVCVFCAVAVFVSMAPIVLVACIGVWLGLKIAHARWKVWRTKHVRVDVSEPVSAPLPSLLAHPIGTLIAEEERLYKEFAWIRAELGWGQDFTALRARHLNAELLVPGIVCAVFLVGLVCKLTLFASSPALALFLEIMTLPAILYALILICEVRIRRAYRQSGGRWWPNEAWDEARAGQLLCEAFRAGSFTDLRHALRDNGTASIIRYIDGKPYSDEVGLCLTELTETFETYRFLVGTRDYRSGAFRGTDDEHLESLRRNMIAQWEKLQSFLDQKTSTQTPEMEEASNTGTREYITRLR